MRPAIFAVETEKRSLNRLRQRSMTELGLREPADLETWLASANEDLFGRRVLWISRQDRPSDDQRSDLIGIDESGDLLITELKRGEVAEDAIVQALAYAAGYARKESQDLVELFASQSEKEGPTGLLTRAESKEDAERRLSEHVGGNREVNGAQVLVLVGEEFTARTLEICDYLNEASGDAAFSVECWRYGLHQSAPDGLLFLLEQVLPPTTVRQEVEEKREAGRAKKYLRDPVRIDFMRRFIDYLSASGRVQTARNRGQSYECRLQAVTWPSEQVMYFSVWSEHPRLYLPKECVLSEVPAKYGAVAFNNDDGRLVLEFRDLECGKAIFNSSFGERVEAVVRDVQVAGGDIRTTSAQMS